MLLTDLIGIKLSERFYFSQILLPFKQLSLDLQVTTHVANRIFHEDHSFEITATFFLMQHLLW